MIPSDYVYFIAVGDNINRKRWYEKIKKKNLELINVLDNSAIISPNAHIPCGGGDFCRKTGNIKQRLCNRQ